MMDVTLLFGSKDELNRDIIIQKITRWIIVYKFYKIGFQPFKKFKTDTLVSFH